MSARAAASVRVEREHVGDAEAQQRVVVLGERRKADDQRARRSVAAQLELAAGRDPDLVGERDAERPALRRDQLAQRAGLVRDAGRRGAARGCGPRAAGSSWWPGS